MGFHQGTYATVWSIDEATDKYSRIQITTSRRNNQTGQYESDFSGRVTLLGDAHKKVNLIRAGLQASTATKPHCRIKIDGCDVTRRYDKERKQEYINFTIFDFEMPDGEGASGAANSQASRSTTVATQPVDISASDDELPF